VRERLFGLGRRYARLATTAAVARPRLWRLFRPLMRRNFDALAPHWDGIRCGDTPAPVLTVLDRLDGPPRRVLDVGTGTGLAAGILAERFPAAEIVGVDLSPRMIEVARREHGDERVRFDVADAASLPYEDGSFDLAILLNMIPFVDELARVVEPGGRLAVSFSRGPETPIWVPPATLRRELERVGFADVEEFEVGAAVTVMARRVAAN
jgi:SAM-dependent methyltransferase